MNFAKKLQSSVRKHRLLWLTVLGILIVVVGLIILTTRTADISSVATSDKPASSLNAPEDVRGQQQDDKATSTPANSTSSQSEIDNVADNEGGSGSTSTTSSIDKDKPFNVPLTAQAVVVFDVQNKQVLFEKDADTERPLASLTKLMTALVASDSYSSDDEVTITRQHLEALGNNGLVANQTWKLGDLVSYMLMESSNDAARAVASASSTVESDGYYSKAFIKQMNETAQDIGLESTYFFNPSGLDLNETLISGGYGTARDIARLFAYILDTNQEILEPTTRLTQVFQTTTGLRHTASNTNTWLPQFSNILGSKTGYTVLAGGNLVMGFELDNPVVIVVMGSSRTGRFQDMQTLYNATQQYYQNNPPVNSVTAARDN